MNNIYFACKTCCEYLKAGYRWAYWELEHPNVVARGKPVQTEHVLRAESYWNIGETEDWQWLKELLPQVRKFLDIHRTHEIIYGQFEDFLDLDDSRYFDWLEKGNTLVEASPRYFIETLKLANWSEAEDWVKLNHEPWWWTLADFQTMAQSKFMELSRVRSRDIEG